MIHSVFSWPTCGTQSSSLFWLLLYFNLGNKNGSHLPHWLLVKPPKMLSFTFTMVTVAPFPSQRLWNVLAAQPSFEARQQSFQYRSPYVKGFSHSPTLAKNSWLSPMMTDFSITPTSYTDKNIDNEGILAKWWVPFTIFHCIFIIMLIIFCLGKWRVLYPFPQGGMLGPHRATLRRLSLVPCTWVTRANWSAVKVLFEENSSRKRAWSPTHDLLRYRPTPEPQYVSRLRNVWIIWKLHFF